MHNHHTPTFSVITVTYNADKVLEETIQSVITQTYHHVEYILVDGASTDGSMNIVNKYRNHIAKVVSEPDQGLYDAMNKGIDLATGDYLCFLNAGDSFHEDDTLQQIVHSITTPVLPDILYGETAIVDAQGHFLQMRRLSAPTVLTWESFKEGMLVCHQAFFAKHTLVKPYDLSYRFSADFDWCIRCLKQAKLIHNTHLVLIDYLSEGLTTQHHRASLVERFRIMSKYYGWLSTVFHHLGFVLRLANSSTKRATPSTAPFRITETGRAE